MTGVHPDYRGRGLGRAVLLGGMTYLTENGAKTIELEVDDLNRSAKELYRSAGFREVGHSLWYERALAG
jgi:ribosomal protein S18 acetylase RimI-like enzyme